MAPTAVPSPAWADRLRDLVTKNLKENPALISYALASYDKSAGGSIQPRVRYVVHRGLVNERRKEGDGSSNLIQDNDGKEYLSDKLVITTDARSPKARQLASSPHVELAWWLASTQHQFRIVGSAYILPSPSFSQAPHTTPSSSLASTAADIDPSASSFSFPFPAGKLAPYDAFSWEQERVRQFRKLSPELRASFYRPVPGTTLEEWGGKMDDLPQELPEGVEEAEGEEQKKQVEQALKNMALVVIDPTEIDLCDLGSTPNVRTRWRLDASSGEWKEEGLVP
ncbi:hypothetical protein JCM6882_005342 [Rhodosporidiobolus microsporus]